MLVEGGVEDDGPGIHPSEANRVFDRFFRGKAGSGVPGGTGLGLTIVHDLAAGWSGWSSSSRRGAGHGSPSGSRSPARPPSLPSPNLALADRSSAGPYPETMRHRLAIVLTVIGAIALPVVMAATVLYASDAAIGGSVEPLTPQFGTTTPAHDQPQTHEDQGGSTGGGSSTGGGDDHGGSTGSSGGGTSGGGSDDTSGGGSNSGSGSSGSGSGSGSGGSSHGGGDDGSSGGSGGGGHGGDD